MATGFWAIGLAMTGCAGGRNFDVEVVPQSGMRGEMSEEWRRSVASEPYLPPAPEVSEKVPEVDEGEGDGGDERFVTAVASGGGRFPYGVPVPGKKDLVRSPFSDSGFVDVSGAPPESEVKCPYTGKIFLVP